MTLVPGTYTARAVEGGLGEAMTGKPQVVILLQALDDGFAGETITWFGYFTDKTTERTMESLRALGWKTDDLTDLSGITDNEVRIVVTEETYEGKTRLRVAWINRPGGLALRTPLSPEKARAFANQMKGAAVLSRQQQTRARPASTATSPKQPQQAQAPSPEQALADEDIPF